MIIKEQQNTEPNKYLIIEKEKVRNLFKRIIECINNIEEAIIIQTIFENTFGNNLFYDIKSKQAKINILDYFPIKLKK